MKCFCVFDVVVVAVDAGSVATIFVDDCVVATVFVCVRDDVVVDVVDVGLVVVVVVVVVDAVNLIFQNIITNTPLIPL